MRYRFGIDIDGTVTSPTSLIPHINKQFNSELTLDDIKEYDLTSALPHLEPGEFYSWFREAESMIYASSPVSENAKNILNQWKERYELFYISARGENVSDITLEWFKKHAIAFDHIELIGTHNKIETAKRHNVDLFFEDKHDNAVEISEELDIPVLLFDTPYNRLPVPKNVIRVYNWLEAEEFVKNEFSLEELKTK
ncbi:nucleotidase [Planococcus sp. CAU13]|uniref:nucleotidase n=1 Tax=Planococcus sp. CAU13 TaxID=1541197 RepID=UPI0005300AFD|nr:nucleotidase [Planococcus sp. CAU13]